ncbi:hypothetical protein VARIO8X_50576 [Burkholderiales bacterium 8X]|nr:hypothetical protein VARIO8X_50576 [Burkholderiales bacterium 8X]
MRDRITGLRGDPNNPGEEPLSKIAMGWAVGNSASAQAALNVQTMALSTSLKASNKVVGVFSGRKPQSTLNESSPSSESSRNEVRFEEGEFYLVGANRAIIDPRKLTQYSLNAAHPVGRHKALVFKNVLGFTEANADDLLKQLHHGIMNNRAFEGKVDQYGTRFTVDIAVSGPNGTAVVRTGWIYKPESTTPELTTLFVK